MYSIYTLNLKSNIVTWEVQTDIEALISERTRLSAVPEDYPTSDHY